MERIVKDNKMEHLNEYNIIKSTQYVHVFTRGRSCLTNLLEFFEEAYERIDDGKAVDVIYLDFAKAFYRVPTCNRRLAKSYKHVGLDGKYLLGFKAGYQVEDKRLALVTSILAGWLC